MSPFSSDYNALKIGFIVLPENRGYFPPTGVNHLLQIFPDDEGPALLWVRSLRQSRYHNRVVLGRWLCALPFRDSLPFSGVVEIDLFSR